MSKSQLRIKTLAALIFTIALLGLMEIVLRLVGFQAYQPVQTQVYSEPANALLPHAQYGLALNPGQFEVSINKQLKYQVTHLADSTRSCGAEKEGRKEIHLYGCSLTYGMGVDDEQTYPALLQNTFPDYQVKNFGVPGYGTIHSLLQLKRGLEKGLRPEMVILGYSDLHDARNMLTGIQQKYWSATLSTAVHAEIDQAIFPYAKIKGGQLQIFSKSVSDFSRPWPISKHSVFAYRLEMTVSNIWYGFNDKYKLSEKIVQEMQGLCKQHNIPFLVLGLDQSPSLVKLQRFAAANNLPLINCQVDLYDPAYNLQPQDAHPNSRAHGVYAEKLIDAIGPYFSSKLSMLEREQSYN